MRGLMKAAPPKEEIQAFIDCTGNLQVWRVNGQQKILLQAADHSKFYSGDCYVFQYSYPGEEKEEVLIGTWFGKQSVEVSSPVNKSKISHVPVTYILFVIIRVGRKSFCSLYGEQNG